jgi:hypothetical protein
MTAKCIKFGNVLCLIREFLTEMKKTLANAGFMDYITI